MDLFQTGGTLESSTDLLKTNILGSGQFSANQNYLNFKNRNYQNQANFARESQNKIRQNFGINKMADTQNKMADKQNKMADTEDAQDTLQEQRKNCEVINFRFE